MGEMRVVIVQRVTDRAVHHSRHARGHAPRRADQPGLWYAALFLCLVAQDLSHRFVLSGNGHCGPIEH